MKTTLLCSLSVSFLISLPLSAQGQLANVSTVTALALPSKISYQGLLDSTGVYLNGTRAMVFRLYTDLTAGTLVWQEPLSGTRSVQVTNGLFSVLLGSVNSLNSVSFDAPYWLSIEVAGVTLNPRIELATSAYSFNTARIQGKPISLTSPSAGQVLKWSGSDWAPATDDTGTGTVTSVGTGSGLTGGPISTSGTISIATGGVTTTHLTNSSVTTSKINSSGATLGQVLKYNGSNVDWSDDLQGGLSLPFSGSTSTSTEAFLVTNSSTNADAKAVAGWHSATSGTGNGIFGRSSSTTGTGVYGTVSATSGFNYGVYGHSASGSGSGVLGWASLSSGNNIGVWGQSESVNGTGIMGLANASSGTTYGVYGSASSSSGYAGYFSGRVHATGNLSTSGTKPFRIDHPLDPANKYLYHFSLESPEVKNMYDGVVTLSENGEAMVQLPDYFSALNTGEYRYQLTAIGAAMPNLHVAQEISANTFRIAGGEQRGKVSWQISAFRNDQYIKDHQPKAEVEKTVDER